MEISMNEMKCVCVEDEPVFRHQITEIIKNYERREGVTVRLQCYDKPELLLYDLEENHFYDLYLLDIEFPGHMDGLALAREIRAREENACIVFLTSHSELALEGYDCHAFQFLLKDRMEKLDAVLGELAKKNVSARAFRLISNRDVVERVNYDEICYVRKEGKNCVYICENGRICTERMALSKLFDELGASEMRMVGKAYIINMNHVKALQGYEILFDADVEPVHVGRPQKELVKKELFEFFKEKLQ